MPKISACIVAYCDYDEVCAAVRSILHYTPAPDLALYVVDNGSPDGCGRQLAETDFGDSRVTVLPLEKNIGFGKGHNYVLDRLTSDVHFILNPDILLTGDVPSPISPPSGCHFHQRCPHATDLCRNTAPSLQICDGGAHEVACHTPLPVAEAVPLGKAV